MQVALINHDYPPYIFGGIGNFVSELAKGLSKQGVKVYVITGYPKNSRDKVPFRNVENGVEVFRFPFPPVPPRHTLFQLSNYKEIQKLLQSLNVDIIHGQCGASYPLIGNLKKISPVMVTFHGSPLYEKIYSAQSIVRGGSRQDFTTFLLGYPAWHFTYKKELQEANTVVTVSKALKGELLLEMGQMFDKKIKCIHNGIDIQSLDAEYNQTPESCESKESILFAGRLYWRKGALNIIKMAYVLQKKKTNFRIIVHGTGPLFKKMQEQICSLNLKNVVLKGFTTRQELLKSLSKCKFVAIPSMYEACPMILLESMCLGKIPLLFDLPFSNELTQKGKYSIIGDNIEDLVNKLTSFENSSLSAFSQSIRSFARNAYNMDRVTAEYIESYKNICE